MKTFVDLQLIDGVEILQDKVHLDDRGSFNKIECSGKDDFAKLNSIAISRNAIAGTLRGLHFQCGINAEEKIVKCVRGKIFDVIVDLRTVSHTFGKWSSMILSEESHVALYLPAGIAHGYQTLLDESHVLYVLRGEYDRELSYSLKYDDEHLNIPWPLSITKISSRDLLGISFAEAIEKFK